MNAQSPMTGKQALRILIDIIKDEGNAFSIQSGSWLTATEAPFDSHKGNCGSPACILGWHNHLCETLGGYIGAKLSIPNTAFKPSSVHATTDGKSFLFHPKWFTRARAVAMLEHVYATFDEAIGWGETNWQALEGVRTMSIFKAGQEYTTRDGRRVIVDATDRGGEYPVHGAVKNGGEWIQTNWTAKGRHTINTAKSDLDLMSLVREYWVNVYPNGWGVANETAEEARYSLLENGETIHVCEVKS